MSWRHNVERAIAAQCLESYRAAGNKPGKRHKPYRVPELAGAMVAALDSDDEYEGKRLLLLYRTGALSLV